MWILPQLKQQPLKELERYGQNILKAIRAAPCAGNSRSTCFWAESVLLPTQLHLQLQPHSLDYCRSKSRPVLPLRYIAFYGINATGPGWWVLGCIYGQAPPSQHFYKFTLVPWPGAPVAVQSHLRHIYRKGGCEIYVFARESCAEHLQPFPSIQSCATHNLST